MVANVFDKVSVTAHWSTTTGADSDWDDVIALVDFDGDITDHKDHSITGDTDSDHYGTNNGKFGGAFTNNGSDATNVKINGLTETGDTTIECWFNIKAYF